MKFATVDHAGAPAAIVAVGPHEVALLPDTFADLGDVARYESRLDPLVREAAILMVAVHEDCAFEWFAHVEAARSVGLHESQVQQIEQGAVPTGLSRPQEQALVAVDMMLRRRSLDDPVYRDTCQALGRARLAELVWLTGYYTMLALALAVFRPAHPAASSAAKHDEQSAT